MQVESDWYLSMNQWKQKFWSKWPITGMESTMETNITFPPVASSSFSVGILPQRLSNVSLVTITVDLPSLLHSCVDFISFSSHHLLCKLLVAFFSVNLWVLLSLFACSGVSRSVLSLLLCCNEELRRFFSDNGPSVKDSYQAMWDL